MANKTDIKAKVKLQFVEWHSEATPPPLRLEGSPDSIAIDTVFDGDAAMSPTKLYEILKAHKEQGLVPVFRLSIPDEEEKTTVPKDDKK
jgi:hypothetical protein